MIAAAVGSRRKLGEDPAECREVAGPENLAQARGFFGWPNENRPTMDGGERRKPLWIDGAASGLLSLLARSQGRAGPCLAQGLSRPSPCRCLRRLRRAL